MDQTDLKKLTVAYLYSATFNEDSYQEQQDGINTFSGNNGHVIDAWIKDGDGKRDGQAQMLEQIKAGQIERVYVLRSDRLARDIRKQIALLETLDQHDVEIIPVEGEIIDPRIRGLLLAVNETHSEQLRRYRRKLRGDQ